MKQQTSESVQAFYDRMEDTAAKAGIDTDGEQFIYGFIDGMLPLLTVWQHYQKLLSKSVRMLAGRLPFTAMDVNNWVTLPENAQHQEVMQAQCCEGYASTVYWGTCCSSSHPVKKIISGARPVHWSPLM